MKNEQEEQIRTELLEAILEYIDGRKSFRTVLTLGITCYNKQLVIKDRNIADVITQLNLMGDQVSKNYKYSREEIKNIFTSMLEKLTK